MMKKITILSFAVSICCSLCAQKYHNPIISGFHPDPSICKVGDNFYLVNSSFQYFPGVPIYNSKDLIHWKQIGNVLDRPSQLPLNGASSWLGIYAPTIRYSDGIYFMITTNVGNGGNFLVTAANPQGPWSEPIWLEQQGIDPSLYFENGRCYMVSNPDNTITLCEIDPKTGKTLSQGRPIWRGNGGRYPEGPHIYKKDGYYYLLISEGGTELAHHLTIARSRNIYGPYESNPANPILTNCNMKGQSMQIQGTGHGDFVQADDGSWWVIFLAYRNFGGSYHHLGRETFLAPMDWNAGEWPMVNSGNPIDTVMSARLLSKVEMPKPKSHTTFENENLGFEWINIQNPIKKNYQFKNGELRLTAHSTLSENNQPTFLGRRQENPNVIVETCIDLQNIGAKSEDTDETDETGYYGLSVYQINDGHFDLCTNGMCIYVRCHLKTLNVDCTLNDEVPILKRNSKKLRLRITSDGNMYHFLYAVDNGDFHELARQNCSLLSTEVARGFTGVVIGMFADGKGSADFQYFDYTEGLSTAN